MSSRKRQGIRISILVCIVLAFISIVLPNKRTRFPTLSTPMPERLPELSQLIQNEDYPKALALIEQGGAVDPADKYGKTPLIVACAKNSPSYDVIKALLRKGADANVADRHGSTALGFAIDAQDLDMAELLLKAGADVNRARYIKNTALVMAAENSEADWRLLKLLMRHGGNVNERGMGGNTPLMIIALRCDAQMAKYLLDAGAAVAIKNNVGRTALDLAREHQCTKVASLLESGSIRK